MTDLAIPDTLEGLPQIPSLPASSSHIPAMVAPPDASEWETLLTVCQRLAKSTLVPKDLRNKPDDILVIALTARELRLGLMTALNKVHVIEGKPSMSAELMTALIQRDGHLVQPKRLDNDMAVVRYRRRDWPEGEWGEFAYTKEDAFQAGLLAHWWERKIRYPGDQYDRKETWSIPELVRPEDVTEASLAQWDPPEWVVAQGIERVKRKDNWWHYRKSLLWARGISQVGRMGFADVLMGVSYTPEEMGFDIDPATGEPLDNLAPQEQRDDLTARARNLPPSLGAELRSWAQDVQAPPLTRCPLRWVAAWESAIEQRESFVVDAPAVSDADAGEPAGEEDPPPPVAGGEETPPSPEPEPVPEPPESDTRLSDDAPVPAEVVPASEVPADAVPTSEPVAQSLPLTEPNAYPETLRMAWMMPVAAVAKLERDELVGWCDLLGIPSAGSNADRAQRIHDAKPFTGGS